MKKATCVCCVVLAVSAGLSSAETVIELGDRPVVQSVLDDRAAAPPADGGLVSAPTKANEPLAGQWFIPYFAADKRNDGDSTYFAIRNEGALASTVVVEFFDVDSDVQTTESYDLEPRQVTTVAVRHVPNLSIGSDGYARGFLKISSLVPIMVDAFQLETRNAFAVGGVGFVEGDFCTRWNARFLRFGSSGGTTLSMMVNGPRGAGSSDPPTLAGDVYSENGEFVGSFTVRTDQWAMEIPVQALVPAGVDFGVVELVINATYFPSGIVEVQHQALGQFSVGHWAICMD
ncbi:MAG: hypothetical protein PVG53_08655 [Holophagae bacterium]